MMAPVILVIVVVGWLLLSVLASLVVAAVGRAGLLEDRSRGYLVDHR